MNWNCSEHFEKSLIILPDKWGWNLGVPTLRFESVWVWTKDDICIFSMNFHLHRLSLLTNKKQDSSLNGKSFFWVHSNFKKELSKINFLILFWSLDFGYRSRTVKYSLTARKRLRLCSSQSYTWQYWVSSVGTYLATFVSFWPPKPKQLTKTL